MTSVLLPQTHLHPSERHMGSRGGYKNRPVVHHTILPSGLTLSLRKGLAGAGTRGILSSGAKGKGKAPSHVSCGGIHL
jgi:hypothetical protein